MSGVNFKKLSREMERESSRGSSLVILITLVFFVFLVVFSTYAELDNVTRGEGRIISSMQNQSVQAAEGGVILNRYVSENSTVSKGDLLFEINPIDALSELNQMSQRLSGLRIRESRLQAEIEGDMQFIVDRDLAVKAPNVALSEESLFVGRRLETRGQISVLEQRLARTKQDVVAGDVRLASASKTMELLSEEIDVVEPLVLQNIAPATQLLGLKREFETARAAGEAARVKIEQAKLAIVEINREIENKKSDYRLTALDELAKVLAQKSELSQALPRLTDRVSRTLIKAPMDGVINTLNFRTQGGYVRTGDVVLELVPTGEALMIEAKIKPKDISSIKRGDEARIRLTAYNSMKYGFILGRVERISADATGDDRPGSESYYLIDVLIESDLLLNGNAAELMPGMTASVDILSGKRTVFEYFWNPMAKVKELALRD
jgi:membrane fusion protein, adhesin transport system